MKFGAVDIDWSIRVWPLEVNLMNHMYMQIVQRCWFGIIGMEKVERFKLIALSCIVAAICTHAHTVSMTKLLQFSFHAMVRFGTGG